MPPLFPHKDNFEGYFQLTKYLKKLHTVSLIIPLISFFSVNANCNQNSLISTTLRLKRKQKLFCILTNQVSCVLPGDPAQSVCSTSNVPSSRGSSRVGSSDDDAPSTPPFPCTHADHVSHTSSNIRGLSLLDYPSYMTRFLAAEEMTPLSSPGASSTETSPTIKGSVSHAHK